MSEIRAIHYRKENHENVMLILLCDDDKELKKIIEAVLEHEGLDINDWEEIQFSEEYEVHGKVKIGYTINDFQISFIGRRK